MREWWQRYSPPYPPYIGLEVEAPALTALSSSWSYLALTAKWSGCVSLAWGPELGAHVELTAR